MQLKDGGPDPHTHMCTQLYKMSAIALKFHFSGTKRLKPVHIVRPTKSFGMN